MSLCYFALHRYYPAWQRFFPPSKEKEKKPLHGSARYSIEHARTKAQILSADKSSWLFYIMICAKIQTGYNGF